MRNSTNDYKTSPTVFHSNDPLFCLMFYNLCIISNNSSYAQIAQFRKSLYLSDFPPDKFEILSSFPFSFPSTNLPHPHFFAFGNTFCSFAHPPLHSLFSFSLTFLFYFAYNFLFAFFFACVELLRNLHRIQSNLFSLIFTTVSHRDVI